MKIIFLLVFIVFKLCAKDETIVEKKVNMGNNNYASIDYDKEWNQEGTLKFSKNLQCYLVSSGNMTCNDNSNYNEELYSLKEMIFLDVESIIQDKKALSLKRVEDYCDLYNNFDFKGTSYEALFSYLFLVNSTYSKQSKVCLTPKFTKILSIDSFMITKSEDVEKYNNMAYFIQQFGANKESAFLLEKIIAKFPDRTVAYLNLGDAYWGMGDKVKAISVYQTYIHQMKQKGLEAKIPKKVLERI
ncbi:MAG: tetratricopeptide repeat protein [Epsilonproteobacteria bacterium]|nr:tetratricopeptide repeat protein [Campylobacterota bacterium]